MRKVGSNQFEQIFARDTPLLDVRARIEFSSGSFPQAVNIPILDDDQREAVGIEYKRHGPRQAEQVGFNLVSGSDRDKKVEAWKGFVKQHPQGLLYCFRGGQRSLIAQRWLMDEGVDIPRIEGGYKSMRRFLIDSLQRTCAKARFIVLAGKTGTGKTRLIKDFREVLDLEMIAHHRGSAFGKYIDAQPPQVDFENGVAIACIKAGSRTILLEDESRMIGQRQIPPCLFDAMKSADLVVLEDDLDSRVEHIFDEYITIQLAAFEHRTPQVSEAFEAFSQQLRAALASIRKRLGGVRYRELKQAMEAAITAHAAGDPGGHRVWIRDLLMKYYDPMYEYQLSQKHERIAFSGDREAIQAWLKGAGITKRRRNERNTLDERH